VLRFRLGRLPRLGGRADPQRQEVLVGGLTLPDPGARRAGDEQQRRRVGMHLAQESQVRLLGRSQLMY